MFAILFCPFLWKIHSINVTLLSVRPVVTTPPPVRVFPRKVVLHVCSVVHEKQQIHVSQIRFMGAEAAEHYGLSCKYVCRELLKSNHYCLLHKYVSRPS